MVIGKSRGIFQSEFFLSKRNPSKFPVVVYLRCLNNLPRGFIIIITILKTVYERGMELCMKKWAQVKKRRLARLHLFMQKKENGDRTWNMDTKTHSQM